jgi:hypothetical protein
MADCFFNYREGLAADRTSEALENPITTVATHAPQKYFFRTFDAMGPGFVHRQTSSCLAYPLCMGRAEVAYRAPHDWVNCTLRDKLRRRCFVAARIEVKDKASVPQFLISNEVEPGAPIYSRVR